MSNRGQFRCIENIQDHKETPRNAQESTGEHGKDVIMSDKGHREFPINTRTSTNLPSAVVVGAVLFLFCCC